MRLFIDTNGIVGMTDRNPETDIVVMSILIVLVMIEWWILFRKKISIRLPLFLLLGICIMNVGAMFDPYGGAPGVSIDVPGWYDWMYVAGVVIMIIGIALSLPKDKPKSS